MYLSVSAKYPIVLLLKIRSEESRSHTPKNLFARKEASSVEFRTRLRRFFRCEAKHVDELAFALTLEDVLCKRFHAFVCVEVGEVKTDLFPHLTMESRGDVLTPIDVAPDGRIPTVGLNVLPHGTMQEEEFALGVKHVKMYNGMERFVDAVVCCSAGSLSDDVAIGIYHGKKFLRIIFHFGILLDFCVKTAPARAPFFISNLNYIFYSKHRN